MCSELPFVDPLAVPFDLAVASALLLFTVAVFGGWHPRMFFIRPDREHP